MTDHGRSAAVAASGSRPTDGANSSVVSPADAASIPNAPLQQLRDNADALHAWFKSMDEQRTDWTYPRGVERDARDALEGVYRVAASVIAGLQQAASAIEARRAETVQQGSVHESATLEEGDAQ